MAQGGIPVLGESTNWSEEVYDYQCKLCRREATFFCPYCDVLCCDECIKRKHNTAAYKSHAIVSVTDWGQKDADKCKLCAEHGGGKKMVEKICKDHEEFCCTRCAHSHHSFCTDVSDIRTHRKRGHFGQTKDELNQRCKKRDKLLRKKRKNEKELSKSRESALERLTDFKQKLQNTLNQLETEAKTQIEETYMTMFYELEIDIDEVEASLAELRLQRMIINSKTLTEIQRDVQISRTEQLFNDQGECIKEDQFNLPEFHGDKSLLQYLQSCSIFKQNTHELSTMEEIMSHDSHESTRQENEEEMTREKEEINDPLDAMVHGIVNQIVQSMTQDNSLAMTKPFLVDILGRIEQEVCLRITQNESTQSAIGVMRNDTEPSNIRCDETVSLPEMVSEIATVEKYKPPRNIRTKIFQESPVLTRSLTDPLFYSYNIRLCNDQYTCNIQGICGLTDGNIILSDTKNKKLKQMNQQYRIIAFCEVPAGPRAVCSVEEDVVATALSNKTIQFVTVKPNMKLAKSFLLDHDCFGLSYVNERFYVTKKDGNSVYVYDKSGSQVMILSGYHMSGSPKFHCTQQVYITRDGSRVYVADTVSGLVTVSPNGQLFSSLGQSELKGACAVCTDTHGNVYVSGWKSHTIVKYGRGGGTALGTILSDGIDYPMAIWFNSETSHLIVSSSSQPFGNDFIRVYGIDKSTW